MEHTKHIWRAVLLLLILGGAGVGARHFMIPESFGDQGFFRYGSLGDYMSLPVIHGGRGSCTACHEEIATAKSEGKHAGLNCESCHAPVTVHADDDEKLADMPTNPSVALCANCHQILDARPDTMPQVDIRAHLEEIGVISAGEDIPESACVVCHDVHSPSLE